MRARVLRRRRQDARREQRQALLEAAARMKQRLKEKKKRARRMQLSSLGRKEDSRRRSRLLRGDRVFDSFPSKLGRSHGRGGCETAGDMKVRSRACLSASALQRHVVHVAVPRSAWKRVPGSCAFVASQRRSVCLRRHHVFVPETKGERPHAEKMSATCSVASSEPQRDTPESSEEVKRCADGACASCRDGVASAKTCEASEGETCAPKGGVLDEPCSLQGQASLHHAQVGQVQAVRREGHRVLAVG